VPTTPSGLTYEETTEGTGVSPRPGQTAVVHYTGYLTDGTKFDSSVDRGQPFSFVIGQGEVIRGWDEGVATMKVGGKRRLTIPPDLGYGARRRRRHPAQRDACLRRGPARHPLAKQRRHGGWQPALPVDTPSRIIQAKYALT